MITNAIIQFFGAIIGWLVNNLPDSGIVAFGNGASTGTVCCAAFFITGIETAFGVTTSSGPLIQSGVATGIAAIANSPIALLIDWTVLGFFVGCALSILVAFVIVRILIMFWQQVKW